MCLNLVVAAVVFLGWWYCYFDGWGRWAWFSCFGRGLVVWCNSVFLCSVGLVVGDTYLCLGFDTWADWMGLFVLGVVRYWLNGFSGWGIVWVVFVCWLLVVIRIFDFGVAVV